MARVAEQPVWTDPASGYVRRNVSPAAPSPIQLVDVVFAALAEIRKRGVPVLLVEQRAQRTVAFADRPDYRKISAELDMPHGSIGPTRRRCLAKLRELLANDVEWSK